MVLPLVLGLAGLAAAGSAGGSMLSRHLQEREREGQAQRWREAIAGATGPTQYAEAPRMDPNDVGPQLPMAVPGQLDMMQLGQALAQQGDPMGMQILTAQSDARSAFDRQVQLQQMRDQAAMERTLAGRQQRQTPMVEYIPMGSSRWVELQREGQGLARIRDVMEDFRDVLSQSGSESVGRTAQKLGSLRKELIYALSATTEAGALGDEELEFFGARIPDPTRWTPEFMAQEVGKLEAMADWYNSQVEGHQMRAQFTEGLKPLRLFPSESLVPRDWTPVDESEIGPEETGTVAPPPPVAGATPPLAELLERAEAGGYVSPAEWRGR